MISFHIRVHEQRMVRALRLLRLWDWLPAFRAVAETQHLPTAAEAMHVSPSALSRSVRLLEEDLGRPLFDRVGRAIVLNPAGERMLLAVRDAMRLVDDGLVSIEGSAHLGVLRVACETGVVPLVLEAIRSQLGEHPGLEPTFHHPLLDGGRALLRGEVDVVVGEQLVPVPGVEIERLGSLPYRSYAAKGHVVHAGQGRLRDHPFAALTVDAGGRETEPWPSEQPRRVEVRAHHRSAVVAACQSGRWLAFLPELVGQAERLVAVRGGPEPVVALQVGHRRFLREEGAAQALVVALKQHCLASEARGG